MKEADLKAIRNWRRRGFYSENKLVKLLHKNGYKAVRVPVSNPSLSPLPDVIARRELDVYAFEVKNAGYYAYFPKQQINKLFEYLDQMVPIAEDQKHAVIVAHFGKKWIFQEMQWTNWKGNTLLEQERLIKTDKGNFNLATGKNAEQNMKGDC
jgi:Holliday junction resolvase